MAKIRNSADLVAFMDDDMAWRRTELTWLDGQVHAGSTTPQNRALCRAAVTLSYAHWEGFVRSACVALVRLLHGMRVPVEDLSDGLAALCARKHLEPIGIGRAGRVAVPAYAALKRGMSGRANVSSKFPDLKSNLSYDVLIDNVLEWLGISGLYYEPLKPFINEGLVGRRNRIAHGEYVDISDAKTCVERTIGMLVEFKRLVGDLGTDIERMVRSKTSV